MEEDEWYTNSTAYSPGTLPVTEKAKALGVQWNKKEVQVALNLKEIAEDWILGDLSPTKRDVARITS